MNPLRFLAIVVAVFAALALLSWMLAVPAAAADVPSPDLRILPGHEPVML